MNMDDLANALNKSNATPKAKGGQPASSQPDLNGLLGALGGGGQQAGGQPDLGSLLGMLGGGQSGQGGGALGSLLGGFFGGGSSSGAVSGGPLDALVGPLAEKLGLPPQVAGMVVMFLANALLAGQAGSRSGVASGGDLNDVMTMLDSGRMDGNALHNNRLVQDLSQQTGLDEQTAARSIGAVVDMLGGQQGLESLLGK
jgi:hypothetical protein